MTLGPLSSVNSGFLSMTAQSVTAQANNKVIVFDNKIFFNLLMDTLEDVFLDSVSGSEYNRYEARWLPVL